MQETINDIANNFKEEMGNNKDNYCITLVTYLPSKQDARKTSFIYKDVDSFRERALDHASTIDSMFSIDFEMVEYA
jgi:hypothetical protein